MKLKSLVICHVWSFTKEKLSFKHHCYRFPKFLLVPWWRFKTYCKFENPLTPEDVGVNENLKSIDAERCWRQWTFSRVFYSKIRENATVVFDTHCSPIFPLFLELCFDFSFDTIQFHGFFYVQKATKCELSDFTIFFYFLKSLVEIPWIDNNVINAFSIDWTLVTFNKVDIDWMLLVVFNFHWVLVMTALMLHWTRKLLGLMLD